MFFQRLLSSSRIRLTVDLLWCGSFGAVVLYLVLGPPRLLSENSGVQLELVQGTQRQGLHRDGERLGTILHTVHRLARGWRVENRFSLRGARAADVRLDLRQDLSLEYLTVDADLSRLGHIAGVPALLRGQFKTLGRIKLKGRCQMETGQCRLTGMLGTYPVDQNITAGRGPVVTSAIYPLLARGSLGNQAEVSIFDPLSLRQRVVSFRLDGKETLQLESGRFDALRVTRDLDGLITRVWIDPSGRVIREEMPLGLVVEHESFEQ